jgi:hypothetical protein
MDNIKAGFESAMAAFGGTGAVAAAQRQRVEAAEDEVDRPMQTAMASAGAA